MSFALGEMEMTPHEYYSMTRREFLLKVRGFYKAEAKKWQHTRRITWQVYASQPFAKKKPQNMLQFMPLPGDPKANSDVDYDLIKQEWNSFKDERKAKS